MIRLLLIIAITLFFLAISPMLMNEQGYILVSFAGVVIESTVVSSFLLFILIFVSLMLLRRIVFSLTRFGSKSWQKIVFSGKRKANLEFQQGIVAYTLGDMDTAEHLLSKNAERSEMETTAWIVAAKAADTNNKPASVKHYLDLVNQHETNNQISLEALLVQVSLLIKNQQYASAKAVLDQHAKTYARDGRLLGFRLDIHIAENDYLAAIELLPAAHKHKDISSAQIYRWEYAAYLAMFKHLVTSQNVNKLEEYWAHLSKKQKQSDAILLAYARTLAESNNAEQLTTLLLPIFKKEPSEAFLSGVKLLPRVNCAPLLEQVHLHLKKHPEDTKWLSMLAHLAAADGDWRMAEQTFAKVVPLTKDKTDIIGYARVLETLGQHQKANQQYQSLI